MLEMYTYLCMDKFQGFNDAGHVAKLFSSQLDCDEKIKEKFLPALKALATCNWWGLRSVPIYMLVMLINKKKNGYSLAMSTLPTDVNTIHMKNYRNTCWIPVRFRIVINKYSNI